jgi:hypothetical protein
MANLFWYIVIYREGLVRTRKKYKKKGRWERDKEGREGERERGGVRVRGSWRK